MIDDDDVEADLGGRAQGVVGGGAAVDGDDEFDALVPHPTKRRGAGPVTLGEPIRHIDRQRRAPMERNQRTSSAALVAPSTS